MGASTKIPVDCRVTDTEAVLQEKGRVSNATKSYVGGGGS